MHSFELDVARSLIQDWNPELNELDERRVVRYWKGADSLVFSNIEAEGATYVRVTGDVSDITLNSGAIRPSWFILHGPTLGRQIKVTCLKGTRVGRQLRDLRSKQISVVGLRSIDLAKALEDRYRINLLAVDLQAL